MIKNKWKNVESEFSKRCEKGVVGIGSMSDTYNPLELQYEQTRGALKLLSKYNFGVKVLEKQLMKELLKEKIFL